MQAITFCLEVDDLYVLLQQKDVAYIQEVLESTKQLVMTAAQKGYEFGSNGDSWESLSNKLVVILESR